MTAISNDKSSTCLQPRLLPTRSHLVPTSQGVLVCRWGGGTRCLRGLIAVAGLTSLRLPGPLTVRARS